MVIEYIRYTIDSDRVDGFVAAYAQAAEALAASPHCMDYELARGVEEPDNFILRIEWSSIEGHMKGFRSSPEFRSFFAAVGPYVHDIAEMKHYETTRVHSAHTARS